MGFLVISTARTGSKKAAIIVGPGQARHRSYIKRIVQEAQKQAVVARASLEAQKQAEGFQALPIRLDTAIGIAVPLPDHPGRGYEIYLLAGVDAAQIDAAATRDVQTRLVTQTLGLAEPLISNQIPWAHRGDPANHAQFSGDLVIRDELGSYALMFIKLPDAKLETKKAAREDFNPFHWTFLAFLILSGALLYYLQNYLPTALRGVSKIVSLIPVLLWPFLYTSRYYVPFIIRFLGYPGALTAAFMMGYFYYNLLSTSVLPVAVACALFATVVAGLTVWIQGKILGTSLESGMSVFVKYGGAIVLNIIGLSIAWLGPVAAKGLYVGGMAAMDGGRESPGKIAGMPEADNVSELDPLSVPTFVARNVIKLKDRDEVEVGAICFVHVPGTDKVYGLTSKRILTSRNSDLYGVTVENLVSDLEHWRAKAFRNKNNVVEIAGLAGKPEDYADSEVLFLKLKPIDRNPFFIGELSSVCPDTEGGSRQLGIATSFESINARDQRMETAVFPAYTKGGKGMLLLLGGAKDVSNFEGSPLLQGTTAIAGIVLGGSPVMQKPFDHECEFLEGASMKQIWETLCKVEGIKIETPPPEATSAPTPLATTPSVPTPVPTRAPAAPKPVVMPDPFATADLDKLEKEMKVLKKLRPQLAKSPAAKTLAEQMKRDTEIIRFNRRRNQMIAAYSRLGVQSGQEMLQLIPLESSTPDLSDPAKLQEFRAGLDKIRADLQEKRKSIDPAKMDQVESFYDETEWFNAKSQVLKQALTGTAAPAATPPAASSPATTAAPAVTPLPLPPPP